MNSSVSVEVHIMMKTILSTKITSKNMSFKIRANLFKNSIVRYYFVYANVYATHNKICCHRHDQCYLQEKKYALQCSPESTINRSSQHYAIEIIRPLLAQDHAEKILIHYLYFNSNPATLVSAHMKQCMRIEKQKVYTQVHNYTQLCTIDHRSDIFFRNMNSLDSLTWNGK